MKAWWIAGLAVLAGCGQRDAATTEQPLRTQPHQPPPVAQAKEEAPKPEDMRLTPERPGLDPARLESLAQKVSVCGGPSARDFIDEAKAIAVTRRAVRDGLWLTVGAFRKRDDTEGADGRFGVRIEYPTLDYFGVYADSGVDLVHAQYGEGDGYVLVDRKTGASVEFSAFPVPSPSGRWFAAASSDVAYNDHGVEIVERTSTGFGKMKSFNERVLQTPCGLQWRGDDEIVLRVRKAMVDGDVSLDYIDPPPEMADAALSLRGGAWIYHPPR